jgi:hypothetical protein
MKRRSAPEDDWRADYADEITVESCQAFEALNEAQREAGTPEATCAREMTTASSCSKSLVWQRVSPGQAFKCPGIANSGRSFGVSSTAGSRWHGNGG